MASCSRIVRWIQTWSLRTELIVILLIAFGYFTVTSVANLGRGVQTVRADGLLYGIIIPEIVFGGICLALLYVRGKRVRDFGLRPSWRGGLTGVGFVACLYVVWIGVWVVSVLFTRQSWVEPEPVRQAIEFDLPLVISATLLVIINPLFEEFFVTGYTMKTLCDMGRPTLAVVASVLVRVGYHTYQDPAGWINIAIMGLLFSVYYLARKQLFALFVAHALMNALAFLTA